MGPSTPQLPQVSPVWPPISPEYGVSLDTWLSLQQAGMYWANCVGVLKLFTPDDTPLNGPVPEK
jgi:hypothetical protein